MGTQIDIYLKEIRVKSWVKNLFVFFPIIFSLELLEWDKLAAAILLTLAFCLMSSAIYVLNDMIDVEKDRKHEIKKERPIASGRISFRSARILMIVLMLAGAGLALSVNLASFLLILAYMAINILYSKWLKTMVLIDCFCIAAGFVLRVMVGGTIVSEGVSVWMFLTVVAMSLLMAFGKRRGELRSYSGGETRAVLEAYELKFLDGTIFMCAGLCMVFYSLWSISQRFDFVYTVPIVLFVVIRYLFLVFMGKDDADPTTLILSDRMLLAAGAICALVMLAMLYGSQLPHLFNNIRGVADIFP